MVKQNLIIFCNMSCYHKHCIYDQTSFMQCYNIHDVASCINNVTLQW